MNRIGAGCMILFSLPFAAVGVFMGILVLRALAEGWEMRSWQEVPAQVLASRLDSGSDSDTDCARARYRYDFGGRTYDGERVGIHGGCDNVGDFHRRVARELEEHRASGRPFRCFVDPAAPGESVLYRQLRPGLLAFHALFAVVFGGAGFGILGFTVLGRRRLRARESLRASRPQEPWRWRPEWEAGRIVSGSRRSMVGGWALALFWNLVSAPLLFVLPGEVLEKENYPALLGLLFPLLGAGLLVWAIRATLRWRRFGRSRFDMVSVPGVVGGPLQGVVRIPVRLQPEAGFVLTLSCIRRRTTGSGKHRSTREEILWEDQRVLARGLEAPGSVLPVLFAIPHGARESDAERSDDQVLWRLRVQAEVPGVDVDESFEVPVFLTEASSPDFVLEEGRLTEYERPLDRAEVLRHRRVSVEELPDGGFAYRFPSTATAGQKTVVAVLLAAACIALGIIVRSGAGCLPLAVTGSFVLLLGASALAQWLGEHRIEVRPDRVELAGGSFGLGRPRTVPIGELEAWEAAAAGHAGSRARYDLVLLTHDGRRHIAAHAVGRRAEAELLAAEIARRMEPPV